MAFHFSWTMTFAEVIQAMIGAIGLGYIAFQVAGLRRGREAAAHDRIYAHYTEICKMMAAKPRLYPYFYENARLEGEDPLLRAEINIMSESILALIEHVVLQRKDLPDESWEKCWRPYAQERFDKSIEFTEFFEPNRHWYTDKAQRVIVKLMERSSARRLAPG